MASNLALLRLLQLVSPSLPIGMYSYSQGLERAVHDGWIRNADQVGDWLHGLLHNSLSKLDAPCWHDFTTLGRQAIWKPWRSGVSS